MPLPKLRTFIVDNEDDGVKRRFIGIDPGLSGAIAYIDTVGWRSRKMDAEPVPIVNYNKRKVIDHMALAALLSDLTSDPEWPVLCAVVEQVSAMPKQGVTSSFRFGMAFGALTQACADRDVTTHLVTPQQWRNHFQLIGVDKNHLRSYSRDYFHNRELWPKVGDHNKAEASLLAAYARDITQAQHKQKDHS